MHGIAFSECRTHEDDHIHIDGAEQFVIQHNRRHEDVGNAFRKAEPLHQFKRGQSVEGMDKVAEPLRFNERDALLWHNLHEAAQQGGTFAREDDIADIVFMDAGPER